MPSSWSAVRIRQLVGGGYAIFALAMSIRMFVDGMKRLLLNFPWSVAGWGDGGVDWQGARLFLEGKSPYTPEGLREIGLEQFGFGHPPTTPFWFLPFASLDHATMAETIAILCLMVLLVHVWICADELRLPKPVPTTLLVFTWVLTRSWMQEHLHIVQISEFIAFAYVLAWHQLKRDRDVVGGMALGFACTLKLFPGVMVFYLLLRKRWRAAAAAVASYLAVAAVMTVGYGIGSWALFFRQQGPIAATWMGHIRNASLSGVVLRSFTPTCVAQAVPTGRTVFVAQALGLSLVLVAAFLTRRAERGSKSIDDSFALFTLVSVFINPWSWEHYTVFLIFPVMMLASKIWHDGNALVGEWVPGLPARTAVDRLAALLMGVSVIVAISGMVSIDMWRKTNAVGQYAAGAGVTHRELHWLEVANWLPWVLMLMAFGVLLFVLKERPSHEQDAAWIHRGPDS